MYRPIHFEIHADDVARARQFYADVFGWTFEDYSEFAGMTYFGAVTGTAEGGIDGAIMQRHDPGPEPGGPVAGAVLTLGVDDIDAVLARALESGATLAMAKYALPGMAWQAYVVDTEGNVVGLHQPDGNAA